MSPASPSLAALGAAEAALAPLVPASAQLPLGPLAPVIAGVFTGLSRGDWVFAGPRARVGAVLRGCPVERLAGAATGARPYKLAPVSWSPGARALQAVGAALAEDAFVACILGDASAASGAFAEALNAAALTGARVLFIAPLHRFAGPDAPVGPQSAAGPLALARAFGLDAVEAAPTEDAVRDAVAALRAAGRAAVLAVPLPVAA